MEGLVFKFFSREEQKSEYDWANIIFEDDCVGKARCLKNGDVFTIFSINIYPEFQGNGYGKAFIDEIKSNYRTIVADRVRSKAISFWESVGFIKYGETDNWIYQSYK